MGNGLRTMHTHGLSKVFFSKFQKCHRIRSSNIQRPKLCKRNNQAFFESVAYFERHSTRITLESHSRFFPIWLYDYPMHYKYQAEIVLVVIDDRIFSLVLFPGLKLVIHCH